MEKEYFKGIKRNMLFLEDKEDDKKRHEFESLTYIGDIMSENIKTGLESIRN